MRLRIQFENSTLLRWLSEDARKSRVILLDVDADVSSPNTVRLNFDLVFSPKSIRRRGIEEADYYIGSTGAELSVHPRKGRVILHSEDQKIDASYHNSTRSTRNVGIVIEPKVSGNLESLELKSSIGSAEYKAGQDQQQSSSFTGEERWLQVERANPGVKWVIALPRRKAVVRDYLQGNYHLFAECESLRDGIEGRLDIRASDIRFFSPDRKPLTPIASLLMLFVVWRRGIRIMSQDPESMSFKIYPME